MSKCEQCGSKIGRGRRLCVACESADNSPADAKEVRCICGRLALKGIDLCRMCYREAPRTNPYYETDGGRDLYAGLATTDPNARYVCPGCGGTVVPRNRWGGTKTDYRCNDCGATAELHPVETEPYPELTPDELIKKLSDPKRMMFGPPRAIRELRKKEGRNIYTGEPLGRGTDLDWLVGQKEEEEQNDEPPF